MKKVPGKYFWLLMTITGALMFGAPALVSASEGIASTDTENSAADNAADTPDDDTIAKTTDSAEKNSQETDHSGEGQISKPKYLENAENNGEEIISDEDPTESGVWIPAIQRRVILFPLPDAPRIPIGEPSLSSFTFRVKP